MEILSTGEKIKRARVYNGITLKELCGDKISISKMSCIENGKVKPDEDILRYIADIIKLDYDYLEKDVYEQINENIEFFENNTDIYSDIEKDIKLNLDYAINYDYYELAFKLIHKLFNYYLNQKNLNDILDIVPKYYDLYRKNNVYQNTIIYFKDMANYLYESKEYGEAKNYYNRIVNLLIEKDDIDSELYPYMSYKEGICLLKCAEYDEAEKCLNIAKEYLDNIKSDEIKGDIYHANFIIGILNNREEYIDYVKKSNELLKNNNLKIAELKFDYAAAYFSVNKEEKAIKQISEAVEILPKDQLYNVGNLYIKGARLFNRNNKLDLADEFADKALNIAIEIDNIELIEEAYYLKGMLLQKQGRFREAELYMNLSLDSLMKFGNKKDLYTRYVDMANMYHKTKSVEESIKYFMLAISMKDKI